MKKFLLALLLLAPMCVRAQVVTYATLSGTITDTGSTPYSLGSVIVQFTPPTGQQCGLGSPPNFSFQKTYTIPLDSNGSFSGLTLPTNSSFNCSGSQWSFTTASQGGFGIATVKLTILGTASLSSSLSNQVRISWPSGTIEPPGASGQVISSLGNNQFAWTSSISGQTMTLTGGGTGSHTNFAFPAMLDINCTLCQLATDTAPICVEDTAVPAVTPFACIVMKSNGQVEVVGGNNSATSNIGFDLEVSAAGLAELTGGNGVRIDSINGPITVVPGGGAGGTGTGAFSVTNIQTGPIAAQGTGATLTGSTGACATFTATATSGFLGAAICSGTTGAATLVITPPAGSPTAGTSLICFGSDTTSGHLLDAVQVGASTSTCTLNFTSVTNGDFLIFEWKIL